MSGSGNSEEDEIRWSGSEGDVKEVRRNQNQIREPMTHHNYNYARSTARSNEMECGRAGQSNYFTTDFEELLCDEALFHDSLPADIDHILKEDGLIHEGIRADIAVDDSRKCEKQCDMNAIPSSRDDKGKEEEGAGMDINIDIVGNDSDGNEKCVIGTAETDVFVSQGEDDMDDGKEVD